LTARRRHCEKPSDAAISPPRIGFVFDAGRVLGPKTRQIGFVLRGADRPRVSREAYLVLPHVANGGRLALFGALGFDETGRDIRLEYR
jgi:hypothetical protein